MCFAGVWAWEGVKCIVGVGGVCGRRGRLLYVRFLQSTAWKLVIGDFSSLEQRQ